MSYRHLFAIDPGDANNGFCYFKYDTEAKLADTKIKAIYDEDGLDDILLTVWSIGQVKQKPQYTDDPTKHNPPEMYFVVENFRVDGHVRNKIFQWSEVKTVRQIGKIKMLAKWLDAKFILQEPGNVLPMARKWAPKWVGMPKSGHPKDDASAWCHGVHYMMRMQWLENPDKVIPFGQERLM